MKILQTLLLLLCANVIYAQETALRIEENRTAATKDGVPLASTRLRTTHYLVQHKTDTVNRLLFASFIDTNNQGKITSGFIAAIDIDKKEVRWQIPVTENPYFNLSTNKLVHQEKREALACYDAATGKQRWKKAYRLAYASPNYDFAMSKLGTALELNDGNIVYKRNFTENDLWNDVQYLDKDNIVIACDGLHSVNLKTGYGWYYATPTFCRDCVAGNQIDEIITTAAMVTSAFLTGTIMIWGNPYRTGYNVAGYCSNIIVDEDNVFFASKDKLLRLNAQGKKVWSVNLPKDSASGSAIYMMGDKIFFVNKGYGMFNGAPLWRGENFIALYNKQNGSKVYSKGFEAKEHLLSYLISGDTILIHGGNYLHKINCSTGATIAKQATDDATSKYETFADPNKYYECSDGEGMNLIANKYPENHLITQKANGAVLLDQNLQKIKTITAENCWEAYREDGDKRLLRNNKQTIVLQNGKEILRIDGTDAELTGHTLISNSEHYVDMIEL